MFKLPNLLFDTPDAPAGGGPKGGDKESLVEFLKDDEPVDKEDEIDLEDKEEEQEEEKDDDEKDEDKDDTKDDELEALVEDAEAEEPSDEQLEVVTPVRRKEILAKYPDLFKTFPYLEKAYYREQQFTELFPTIKEAQNASEKSQNFDQIETELMQGNSSTILESVKEMDENSFHKLVDNFLPTLQKVDKEAYVHLLSNVSRHIIADLVNATKKSKNEIYENAASVLNQWLFGTTDFEEPTPLAKKDTGEDEKEVKLREKERDFARRRFETTRSDLDNRVSNSVRSAIETNIDPKGSMTEYVKRTAVREANEALENAVRSDARFKGIVDRLWDAAFKADFSKESVDRIRSAYLSKAKTLLPSVIKRARIEALRGMGKRVREEAPDNEEKEVKTPQKGQKKEGAPRPQPSGRIKEAKDIPKGMSTFDFLSLPD